MERRSIALGVAIGAVCMLLGAIGCIAQPKGRLNPYDPSAIFTGATNWQVKTAAAAFSARGGHSVVVYNSKMWLIGGYDGAACLNDVWSSPNGIAWTPATASAAFTGRTRHACLVFNGKMWIIAGLFEPAGITDVTNDVWYSGDGVSWVCAKQKAAFIRRFQFGAAVFNNCMWVVAGSTNNNNPSDLTNDVWYSKDGTNWNAANDGAPFDIRNGCSLLVHNEKLWLIAGSGAGPYYRDVWSSPDGTNWTQAVATAPFFTRSSFYGAVFHNRIVLIGVYHQSFGAAGCTNDVWLSPDGIQWTNVLAFPAFAKRYRHAAVAFDEKIWLIGGNTTPTTRANDVWCSE